MKKGIATTPKATGFARSQAARWTRYPEYHAACDLANPVAFGIVDSSRR